MPVVNSVAATDDNITLFCSSNNINATLRWQRLAGTTNKWDLVYNGNKVLNNYDLRFVVSVETRSTTVSSNLTIVSLMKNDTGFYACSEAGLSEKYAAELLVLDTCELSFQ